MDTSIGVVFTLDMHGNFTWICENIKDITKYTQEDVIGTNISRYVYPDDLDFILHRIMIAKPGHTDKSTFSIIDKDGKIFSVTSRRLVTNDQILGILYKEKDDGS